ncbi:MAG TPA: DUF2120 domain-containing protein [Methanobacterium sp.]|nr:DUF2120 domain-containing protein [Methanobacterium sp.]
MKTHEIAGNIMRSLEAFQGSRSAMDTPQMLIVRGMSKKDIKPEDLDLEVAKIFQDLGAKQIEVFSDEAKNVIGVMDENIRAQVDIQGETDIYGIYRLKESFEAMNCHTEYGLGLMDSFAVFVVLWMDKSGFGPKFVEIVIVNFDA